MKTIILPGWMSTSNQWKQIIDKFNDIDILDLPGFGEEPLISKDWNVIDYSNWVADQIAKRYPNQEIHIIGHSFGGRIATYLASTNPKWLKRITIYASPSIYRPTTKTKLVKGIARITPSFIKKMIKFQGADDYENSRDTDMQNIYLNTIIFDQTELLKNINIPTTILWGDQDKEVPLKIAEEIKELIPNSKLVVIPNAGHNMHINNPNIFYGTLKNIIDKNS